MKKRDYQFVIFGVFAYWLVLQMENAAAQKRLDDISAMIGDMSRSGYKG